MTAAETYAFSDEERALIPGSPNRPRMAPAALGRRPRRDVEYE
jgi:hypothetical protein